MQKEITDLQKERRRIFNDIVEAYGVKYSWLGAQAAREMLISAATWNIQKYSNPPFRYRTHMMLAWDRGYLKSTMMRKMKDILGDEFVSIIGKVSDAAMRGSVSGGNFTPPKPLQTPFVVSTEFGQTDFNDELLNLFLNLLEEGHTNVALNKIGQLSENQKQNIEKEFDKEIDFKQSNEFDLHSSFVFWGATYDPSKLEDDAMRSRFNVVTPEKPLDYKITQAADSNPDVLTQLSKSTIRGIRKHLRMDENFPTDFRPPERLYEKYNLIPRESRDIQSYMAARNWWGLDVNPEVMEEYISYLQQSRKISTMSPEERVFDLIFDNPTSYPKIKKQTGFTKKQIYKMMNRIDAEKINLTGETKWVIWSGLSERKKYQKDIDAKNALVDDEQDDKDNDGGGFLSSQMS